MKALPTLAVDGGQPVRQRRLPYGHHEVLEEDLQGVLEVLRSDWLTTGPVVEQFEAALAARVGSRYAVAFSSGTAALHGAVFAAGLGPGDEGVTTPLTFCATANALLYQGALPVFCDVCPDTLNLDPNRVAQAVTARTKAILPVDYAGHPADLDALVALAERQGLVVIEDACHALGAELRGRRVGSVSHMTVFSFHPVKHITTGEGGMVTTDNAEFARQLRIFRNQGIEHDVHEREAGGDWYYEMVALGYNYRLSDIGCALGLSQLKRLDRNLERRQQIAMRYTRVFKDLGGVMPPVVRPDATPAWHLYPVQLDLSKLHVERAEIFKALRAEGLGVNVHYIPVHLHPYYRHRFGYRGGEYPVAEEAYRRLISLPLFHSMTDADVEDCIEAVTKVLDAYGQ